VIYVNVLDMSAYTLAAPLHTAEDVSAPMQHSRDPNECSWRASSLLKQGARARRNNRPAGVPNCAAWLKDWR